METRICAGCGEAKPLTDFNFRHKQKGTRHKRCRECTREQVRMHYQAHHGYYVVKAKKRTIRVHAEHRQWLQNYLETHPCVDCGESDQRCLDFDHVRGKKRKNISLMVGYFTLEAIQAEVSKCEVRCANCHRKRTAERRAIARSESRP
jgi:hypothetical protein